MNWTQRFAWALFHRWSGRGDRIPVAFGPLVRAEARPILLLVVVVVVASLVSSLSPLVFSGAVERLTDEGTGRGFLLFLGLYILLLGINRALVETRTMRSARVEQGISVALSERYFSHILHLDEEFFHERNPSRLLSILHTGRHGTRLLVQVGCNVILPGLLEIGFALIILAGFVDLYIATFVGLYGLIHISVTAHSLRKLTPLYRQADEATHKNAALLGNALHAVETIRHFGGEKTIVGRYRRNLHHIRERWHAFYTGRAKYAVLLAVVLVLQFGLGMWWLFERNGGTVPVAEFVLFNMILLQLTRPFELMGNAVRDIGQAVTLFEPMVDILSMKPRAVSSAHQMELRHVGRIDFDHVYFLRGQRLIIDDASFTLERGSFTVVLGETGAGKSTLLKLLLGSVPADDGRVSINGTPVAHYTRQSLYAQAALVPQDIALLNDSVLFNITLGRACADEQVREAVRRAHLEKTLERLPDGLRTLVGERGLKLSGGERQRIAIARALLTGPGLLLLDEASSALDGDTEAAIMDELREMLPDLTVIAVSHRTGIIRPTDNRIVLDHGKAVFHEGS